jgi:hypothetical protein
MSPYPAPVSGNGLIVTLNLTSTGLEDVDLGSWFRQDRKCGAGCIQAVPHCFGLSREIVVFEVALEKVQIHGLRSHSTAAIDHDVTL